MSDSHWTERLVRRPVDATEKVSGRLLSHPKHRIELEKHSDSRGIITVLPKSNSTFDFARIFFVFGSTTTAIRGDHAHRQCWQLLISTSGWTDLYIENPNRDFDTVRLNSPEVAIVIPPMHWACQYSRSNESVLTVCASTEYEASDYIRSYEEWVFATTLSP